MAWFLRMVTTELQSVETILTCVEDVHNGTTIGENYLELIDDVREIASLGGTILT